MNFFSNFVMPAMKCTILLCVCQTATFGLVLLKVNSPKATTGFNTSAVSWPQIRYFVQNATSVSYKKECVKTPRLKKTNKKNIGKKKTKTTKQKKSRKTRQTTAEKQSSVEQEVTSEQIHQAPGADRVKPPQACRVGRGRGERKQENSVLCYLGLKFAWCTTDLRENPTRTSSLSLITSLGRSHVWLVFSRPSI